MAQDDTDDPRRDLAAAALLQDGWDGDGAPAPEAGVIEAAGWMLDHARMAGLRIRSAHADAQGGIVLVVAVPDEDAEVATITLQNGGGGFGFMHAFRARSGADLCTGGCPFDPGSSDQCQHVIGRMAAFVAQRRVAEFLSGAPPPPPAWPKVVTALGVGIVWTGAVIAALPLLLMAGGFALQDFGKRALRPRRPGWSTDPALQGGA